MEKQNSLIVIEVSKEDVVNMQFGVVNNLLDKLMPKSEAYEDSLHILFGGYDAAAEEIFEIKEIRNWVEKLVFIRPEILFFLEKELGALQNILLCLSDYSILQSIHNASEEDGNGSLVQAHIPEVKAEAILIKLTFKTARHVTENIKTIIAERLMTFVRG